MDRRARDESGQTHAVAIASSHRQVDKLVSPQVAPHSKVLDFECADGSALKASQPSPEAGIDVVTQALEIARNRSRDMMLICVPVEELRERSARTLDGGLSPPPPTPATTRLSQW